MNKGFRFTKQKRLVYDEVMGRCDHPTADEIYSSLHLKFPKISKSTVYRNLDVLSQKGLIKRIKFSTSDHFDLTLNKHYHVFCKVCHKVFDTKIKYLGNFDKEVEKETGFIIEDHNLIFEGICPECQKKLNEKEEL